MLLRLPVCPHCHAVYSYAEVSAMKQEERFCYHCKKKYKVIKTKGKVILMSFVCIILICINLLLFTINEDINIIVLALLNLSVITAAVLILPLTKRFKAEKIRKAEKRRLKNKQ